MASMQRLFNDKRWVVIPLALLAAANVVMLGLVLGPLASRVRTLDARAVAAAQDAIAAEADLQQARALASGKGQAQADLQTFYTNVLPPDQASARRLTFLRLAAVARDAGLDFDRRAFTQERSKDARLIRVDLAMEVRGRYDELRQFVHDIESGDDFVVITSVNVGQVDETPGLLQATFGISTYYKAPDGR